MQAGPTEIDHGISSSGMVGPHFAHTSNCSGGCIGCGFEIRCRHPRCHMSSAVFVWPSGEVRPNTHVRVTNLLGPTLNTPRCRIKLESLQLHSE